MAMYCGDEVGAIVADVGNFSSKFGGGGKDTPYHVFHTNAGTYVDTMEDKEGWVLGDANLRAPRDGFEIYHPFLGEGAVPHCCVILCIVDINWDIVEALFRYGVTECKAQQPLPLLLAQGEFNTPNKQEKLLEILFESLQLPAVYISSNAALSSFCCGRRTSLVVDIGAAATRITPIVDGYALHKSSIATPKGGFYLDAQISSVLEQNGISLKPFYESSLRSTSASASHRSFFINEVVRDIKHWMSVVRLSSSAPVAAVQDYALPDGTIIAASASLTHAPELLFASRNKIRHAYSNTRPSFLQEWDVNVNEDSLPELIYDAVMKSDLDARKDLFGNIVVVGGGSLIDGMSARIQADISAMLPANVRAKVVSSQLPVERQFSSWIGGSILSICGSFQQLWLSDMEYREHGASIAAQRFNH